MKEEKELTGFESSILANLSTSAQASIVASFIGVPSLAIMDAILGLGEWTLLPECAGAACLLLGASYYFKKNNIDVASRFKNLNWEALMPGYAESLAKETEGQEQVSPQDRIAEARRAIVPPGRRSMPLSPSMLPDELREDVAMPEQSKPRASNTLSLLSTGSTDILLGHDREGIEIRRTWKQLKAILILGLQGGGKTSTAAWLMAQALSQGARLAVIDKHAKSEEDSMMQKIEPFSPFFDCAPGVDPISALQAVKHVRRVFEEREHGAPCSYPLLFVVDEFSAIMGKINKEGHKWQETAKELADLIEELNQEGRKHKIYAVCIGQVTNASRSGGTEIRDLFNTRIVHGMRVKQAQMLSLTENVKDIRALDQGQVIVDMEGRDEPFFVQVPYLSDVDIKALAEQLRPKDLTLMALPLSDMGSIDLDAVLAALLAKLDKQDVLQLIERLPNRQDEEGEPLSEEEQRYERALKAWESGARSIRTMQVALGVKFNEARELLEEMDNLGIITWRNREEVENV